MGLTQISKLQETIVARTGIDVQRSDQISIYEQAIYKQMQDLQLSRQKLETHLLQTPKALQEFIEDLCVGETYFYRHPFQFKAFQSHITKKLLREEKKNFRCWSAGCARGEEAYSIAIALKECLFGFANYQIFILATDINRYFLDVASKGVYTSGSFRQETPEHVKKLYFASVDKNRYQVDSKLKQYITFRHLNLMDLESSFDLGHFDAIFLRNVMIYWDTKAQRRVLQKLAELLSPQGILIVGPCETSKVLDECFDKHLLEGAYICVPKKKKVQLPLSQDFCIPVIKPICSIAANAPKENKEETHLAKLLKDCKSFANKGDYIEAIEQAIEIVQIDPKHSIAHFFLGLSYENLRMYPQALESYERAVSLEEDFVLAFVNQGAIYLSLKNWPQAKKQYNKALSLLQTWPQEKEMFFVDGLPIEGMLQLVRGALANIDILEKE